MLNDSRPILLACKLLGMHRRTSREGNSKLAKLECAYSLIFMGMVLAGTVTDATCLLEALPRSQVILVPVSALLSLLCAVSVATPWLAHRHLREAMKWVEEFDEKLDEKLDEELDNAHRREINPIIESIGCAIVVLYLAAVHFYQMKILGLDPRCVVVQCVREMCNVLGLARFGLVVGLFGSRVKRLNEMVVNEPRKEGGKALSLFYIYKCHKCLANGVEELNKYFCVQLCMITIAAVGDFLYKIFKLHSSIIPPLLNYSNILFVQLFVIFGVFRPSNKLYFESKRLGRILFSGSPPAVVDSTPIMKLCEFGIYLHANPTGMKLNNLCYVNNALYPMMIDAVLSVLIIILPLSSREDP